MDFQNVNPELFIVVGELLGNVMANELPFNVQNAVGNWLQLVGQAIETYNAQQQYYEQGPGRYFTPDSFNVDNPFCQNNEQSNSSQNTSTQSSEQDEVLPKSSRDGSFTSTEMELTEERLYVIHLQEKIESLMVRMEQLEQEIRMLKTMTKSD